MRKRPRQPKPEMLGEILRKILKKKNIPSAGTDQRLLDLWRRAVGPQIAAQTYPDNMKRGTLIVRVSSSVWMHQLQFLKEDILTRINELSENEGIKGLFFSIGEIPPPPPGTAGAPPPDSTLPPLRGRDRNMVRESLEAVRDEELRKILERVMTREIARRRQREKRKDI
ncbi:MAG: hypothetical protein A2Z43_01125 [Syntrophobacterales bacterium RBG_19FT_COMBO_59_10]|nr:MAG: hypothetical protein A2Z43_01125 [Syntrophobacterales bacterium RBG_19FT_COMBO_59_10]